MHRVAQARSLSHPLSEKEQQIVREELAELLKSPHLSNSKRYPALLSYIVEKTVAGESDALKERVIGIEVFHRSPDYDSNSDTVVRVAAGEVRRRLALIYHESEGEHQIEISLPPGSYIPEFCRIHPQESLVPSARRESTLQQRIPAPVFAESLSTFIRHPLRPKWSWIGAGIGAAILIAALVAAVTRSRTAPGRDASDIFWQPIRAASTPVMLCPGAVARAPKTSYGLVLAQRTDDYTYTSMATTLALADLVRLFSNTHSDYMVQPSSATTLTDMTQHPIILIGAYNNEWTLNLQKDYGTDSRTIPPGRSMMEPILRSPGRGRSLFHFWNKTITPLLLASTAYSPILQL